MEEQAEAELREDGLAPSWHEQLALWLADAESAGLPEPNAMVLATAQPSAVPSARTVLMKSLDARGIEFFTNLDSRKGAELQANRHVCCVFPWYALRRQVILAGEARALPAADSDSYFATRARRSQLGAHASPQSRVIAGREVLEEALTAARERFPPDGPVPRPDRWGGFRVVPVTVEFWLGRRDRLHDRLRFRVQEGGGFTLERLAP